MSESEHLPMSPVFSEFITSKPNSDLVNRTIKCLDLLSPKQSNVINASICMVVRMHFKRLQEYPEDQALALMQMVKYLLRKTPNIITIDTLKDFIIAVDNMLTDLPEELGEFVLRQDVSEELRAECLECFRLIFLCADVTMLKGAFTASFMPALGQLICILTAIATKDVNVRLRIAALHTICAVLLSHSADKILIQRAAIFLAAFGPGIYACLIGCISKDEKLPHSLSVVALGAFSHYTKVILSDDYICNFSMHERTTIYLKMPQEYRYMLPTISLEWAHEMGKKMSLMLRRLALQATHSHVKVRGALVQLAATLLIHCATTLSECQLALAEILLGLLNDENSDVASEARANLKFILSKGRHAEDLLKLLEKSFAECLLAVPRLIISGFESEREAHLKLLLGYLEVLEDEIEGVLMNELCLNRFVTALTQISVMECSEKMIVELTPSLTRANLNYKERINPRALLSRRKPPMKYLSAPLCLATFDECVMFVGCHANSPLIMDVLLHHFTLNPSQVQLVYMMCKLLYGYQHKVGIEADHPDAFLMCETLTQVVLSDDAFSASISELEDLTPAQLNNNTVRVGLLLQLLSQCSRLLGPQYEPLLRTTLFPVVEKLSSDRPLVQHHAYQTLLDFSYYSQTLSISHFLLEHIDYLMSHFTLRLRHFSDFPETPYILPAVMRLGGPPTLPHVTRAIYNLLTLFDRSYWYRTSVFLQTCKQILAVLLQWTEGNLLDRKVYDSSEFLDPSLLAELGQDGEAQMMEDHQSYPLYVDVTESIWEKSNQLCLSSEYRLSVDALDTCMTATKLIAPFDRKLLPLVHKHWLMLKHLLLESEARIMVAAVSSLQVLSEASGDFIRHRVVTVAQPPIMTALSHLCEKSKGAGSSYFHTQDSRLQLSLLKVWPQILANVGVAPESVAEYVTVALGHLSSRQPARLRTAAACALEVLAEWRRDLVRLFVAELVHDTPPAHSGEFSRADFPWQLSRVAARREECGAVARRLCATVL